jgi:hypothetical protein
VFTALPESCMKMAQISYVNTMSRISTASKQKESPEGLGAQFAGGGVSGRSN